MSLNSLKGGAWHLSKFTSIKSEPTEGLRVREHLAIRTRKTIFSGIIHNPHGANSLFWTKIFEVG